MSTSIPNPAAEPVSDAMPRPLGVLETSGLIRLASLQPELEYLFRHVLVQDAAYDTLLKQERRRLHAAVAETLEQLYPDRHDELAAMLAYHYEEAGEADRALPLFIAAGGFALRRYANTEAYAFFRKALTLLGTSDDPTISRHRVEVALGMARAGWTVAPARAMLADLVALEPVADGLGDPVLIGQLQLWTGILHFVNGDPYEPGTEFQRKIDEALATADATGTPQLRGMALTMIGRALVSNDPRRATEVFSEAIELTDASDPIGTSLAADTLAFAYAVLGDFDAADVAIARAQALAERSGDPRALIDVQLFRSQILGERGELAAAAEMARDGAARATAIGATMCVIAGSLVAGMSDLALGNWDSAAKSLQISYDLAGHSEAGWWRNLSAAGLSTVRCARGDVEAGRAGWATSLAEAQRIHDRGVEATIRFQRAKLQSTGPATDWASTADDLAIAAGIHAQMGARPREARDRVTLAAAFDALGRDDDAAAERRRAAELFQELGLAGTESPSDVPVH